MSNVNGTISQTNISIDDVKTVLHSTSNDLGTLCCLSSINPRSRHKPNVGSDAFVNGTYEDAEIFARRCNYGFNIRSFSNLLDCCKYIYQHQTIGLSNFDTCFYTDIKRPPTIYRLTDFSNYSHSEFSTNWAYYLRDSNTMLLDPNGNIDYDVSTLYQLNVNSNKANILPCSEMRYNNSAYDSSNPNAYTLGSCKVYIAGFRNYDSTHGTIQDYFIKTITGYIGGQTKNLTFDELSEIPNAWYKSLENSQIQNKNYSICFLLLSPGQALDSAGTLHGSNNINQTFMVLPDIVFSLSKSSYTASTALSNVVISASGYVVNQRFNSVIKLTNSSNYKFITTIYPSITLKIDYYGRNSTSPDRSQSKNTVEIQKQSSSTESFQMPVQTLGYDPADVAKIVITYSIAPQNGNVVSKNITVNKPSGGWPTTPPL